MKQGDTSVGGGQDTELRLALRDALGRLGKPTSASDLRKALPKPYQRPVAELSRLLDALARDRSVFSLKSGKTVKYSERDPDELLREAILAAIRGGPLSKTALAERVKRAAPGFDKALPAALAALLARGAVRTHPKVGNQRSDGYGLEPPDPTPFLAKAVKDLQALQKKLAPHGVLPEALYRALGRALGLEPDRARAASKGDGIAAASAADDEAAVLAALGELASREPPGALLSVRALRARLPLEKARFDRAALRLSGAGEVVLHHHDFPASLPEVERAELVEDPRGVHYVGIAPGKRT